MKNEKAMTLAEGALEQLAEALRHGRSEALTQFLKTAARFHGYSFQNVMLIAWQRPHVTRVAGFHTWKSLGRQVRKGEKASLKRIQATAAEIISRLLPDPKHSSIPLAA